MSRRDATAGSWNADVRTSIMQRARKRNMGVEVRCRLGLRQKLNQRCADELRPGLEVLAPTPLGKLKKKTYDAAGLLVSYSRRRSSTFIICPLTGHLASRRAAPNAQLAQKT
jgi:hypothetical protein